MTDDASSPTDDASSPTAVALAYLASFATGDADLIASHVSEDFANRHTSALGSSCDGRAAYRQRLPAFLASMPGIRYEPEMVVADGPEVAVFYRLSGRWQGDAPFEVRGAQRLHIEGGLITHRTDYWDSAGFLVQVDDAAGEALGPFGIG